VEKVDDFKKGSLIIDPKRSILLNGSFDEEEADKIVAKLFELGKNPEKNIFLQINSKGGVYVGGMRIYDAVIANLAIVIGVVIGDAFSMAAIILEACQYRQASKNSRLLFHKAYWNIELKITSDSEIENYTTRIQDEINEINRKNAIIKKIVAEKVPEEIGDLDGFLKQEKILTPQEALMFNLIDEII
jgi:ATP-dependent Clp protease protease subunit